MERAFRPVLRSAALFVAGIALVAASPVRGEANALHVAAAADLMTVLPHLAERFSQKTGIPVRISWGASGEEALAIRHHAPYDIFLSADDSFPETLAAEGFLLKNSVQIYSKGILVLFLTDKILTREKIPNATAVLRRPSVRRFALADPRIAPYGKAAISCLGSDKLWSKLRKKAVFGNSLAQVAQYIRTGAVQGGFLSKSQAMILGRHQKGDTVVLSPRCTPYLAQSMGIVSQSPNRLEAQGFERYLLGAEAQKYLRSHGYH